MATDKLVDFDHVKDYISREAVKNAIHRDLDMQDLYLPIEFIELLDDIPAADVVEVVRCKDCKWWTKQDASLQGRCALAGQYPTGEWFCANGQRRSINE